MLLFLVPKYGQYLSGFLNYLIPIIFGITIATNNSLQLTSLFQINSATNFKALGILNIFMLIIFILNGYLTKASTRNSIIAIFIYLGSIFLIGSTEFLSFFVSMEIIALLGYCLISVGGFKNSKDAAIKYFIQGSLAAAVFLLAMIFFYGATHSFNLVGFKVVNHDFYAISLSLFLISICFKLGIFPFHSWSIDVYPNVDKGVLGTNLLINKFFVGFVLVMLFQKLLLEADHRVQDIFNTIITTLALLSAFFGNIAGLAQKKIKRALAYSSVAHSGYILLALVIGINNNYEKEILFFLAFYSVSATLAFMIINYYLQNKENDTYDILKGGFYRDSKMATMLTIAILSLAGIPFTSGFTSKYIVFSGYFREGFAIAPLFIILSSAIGLGYYLKIIIPLFMEEADSTTQPLTTSIETFPMKFIALFLSCIIILGGVIPAFFL
ncbi:MAG: proton-conducting transporter membrane subunit [Bacteriovoracaceae bacterium]